MFIQQNQFWTRSKVPPPPHFYPTRVLHYRPSAISFHRFQRFKTNIKSQGH